MDAKSLEVFDESLRRCNDQPRFLDLFYEKFLASSPKVREKFAHTDFDRQKKALRASFDLLLKTARDQERGPDAYLSDLAERHGARQLGIGAELYDFWLDSLLETVKECDPRFDAQTYKAWEDVMTVGISYLCSRYNAPPRP